MDAVIRIYAPCKAQELARVVKRWLGRYRHARPHHLMELKGLIYDEVRLHAPYTEQLDGFTLQQSTRLAYHMQLTAEAAVALLQMTPFARRARPEVWEQLAASAGLSCQTDFNLHLWQRNR